MAVEDWRPSVDQVAAELRARTKAGESEAGTFTENTRPTEDQVEDHIDEATEDVLAVFASGEVPVASYGSARRVAILKTALTIEASYQPEQAEDTVDSLYRHLMRRHDEALSKLITASQVRDLFGETCADEEVCS